MVLLFLSSYTSFLLQYEFTKGSTCNLIYLYFLCLSLIQKNNKGNSSVCSICCLYVKQEDNLKKKGHRVFVLLLFLWAQEICYLFFGFIKTTAHHAQTYVEMCCNFAISPEAISETDIKKSQECGPKQTGLMNVIFCNKI